MSERFAVYFVLPKDNPIYRIASTWLGHDAYTGLDKPLTRLPKRLKALQDLASNPSTYGFHATLKAPFRLRGNKTRDQLVEAFHAFCAQTEAFRCDTLSLRRIGHFIALTPTLPCERLDLLAAECTEFFEPFRSELSPQEIEKRKPHKLSERQKMLLEQWGYPYVFDEFRFHMTLTNSLDDSELIEVMDALQEGFSALLNQPLEVAKLCLLYQARPEDHFIVMDQQPLCSS